MIVTVTAYVHAYKDFNNSKKVVYRIDSFEQPLTKSEVLVMKKEFQLEIPEGFDLDAVLRETHADRIKQDLAIMENRVADLKKQLSESV